MADIIKVEHLSYIYNPGMPNAATALDDVSFDRGRGRFRGHHRGHRLRQEHPHHPLERPEQAHQRQDLSLTASDLWAEPERHTRFPLPGGSGVPVPGVPAV